MTDAELRLLLRDCLVLWDVRGRVTVADEGVAEKVLGSEWQSAIDALTGHMRAGRIASGFTAAIERCGAVLAAHAPPDGSVNELPDRLYVM